MPMKTFLLLLGIVITLAGVTVAFFFMDEGVNRAVVLGITLSAAVLVRFIRG